MASGKKQTPTQLYYEHFSLWVPGKSSEIATGELRGREAYKLHRGHICNSKRGRNKIDEALIPKWQDLKIIIFNELLENLYQIPQFLTS